MPMPVRTFLDAVDLSGKRVAHVTTHGGSGLGQSHGELAQIEPKAVLLDPHDVYGWQGVRKRGHLAQANRSRRVSYPPFAALSLPLIASVHPGTCREAGPST